MNFIMKNIETKNLLIRKFKMEDALDIYENIARNEEITNCMGYHVHKSIEETKLIVSSYIRGYKMNEFAWAIEDKKIKKVIGFINALELSRENKVCNIKFGIGFKWVDKGLMQEALRSVSKYLFEKEKMNIIVTKFFDGCEKVVNAKCKILEEAGFNKEAILKKRKINSKTGINENMIIYEIEKEDLLKKDR